MPVRVMVNVWVKVSRKVTVTDGLAVRVPVRVGVALEVKVGVWDRVGV